MGQHTATLTTLQQKASHHATLTPLRLITRRSLNLSFAALVITAYPLSRRHVPLFVCSTSRPPLPSFCRTMRHLLLLLNLLTLLSLATACGNPAYYVNGYWNLTTPAYPIPLDTLPACAASANATTISDNAAYYNQSGTIVGTNATGSPACCPSSRPGGGSGLCCYAGGQPVPAGSCYNYVCVGGDGGNGTVRGCVVETCVVLAEYEWVEYGSSTGSVGGAGRLVGGGWAAVGVVVGGIVSWLLLL